MASGDPVGVSGDVGVGGRLSGSESGVILRGGRLGVTLAGQVPAAKR